jgi:hypothetical protein
MMKLQAAWWVFLVLGVVGAAGAMAECDQQERASWNQRYDVRAGEVYDKKTDLTWARCPVGMNWKEGSGCVGVPARVKQSQALELPRHPWRVPKEDELKTLIAPHCNEPVVDQEIFPNTPSEWFYTAETDGAYCWRAHFGDGRVGSYGHAYLNCDYTHAVRLARSGE